MASLPKYFENVQPVTRKIPHSTSPRMSPRKAPGRVRFLGPLPGALGSRSWCRAVWWSTPARCHFLRLLSLRVFGSLFFRPPNLPDPPPSSLRDATSLAMSTLSTIATTNPTPARPADECGVLPPGMGLHRQIVSAPLPPMNYRHLLSGPLGQHRLPLDQSSPSLTARRRHSHPGCCKGDPRPCPVGSRLSHQHAIPVRTDLAALRGTRSSASLLKLRPC